MPWAENKNKLKALMTNQVFTFQSNNRLLNFYRNNNCDLDLPNGFEIRQENLLRYIDHFAHVPKILLLGEAPGWKGCRFSGVPMTSERQLLNNRLAFTGSQSSTKKDGYTEATSTMFWNVNQHLDAFIWNAVPFHPHDTNATLKNRTPSADEIEASLPILAQMLTILNPAKIGAIGRIAESALIRVGAEFSSIRHPSNGGKSIFTVDVQKIMKTDH